MSIWFTPPEVEQLNETIHRAQICSYLDMQFIEIGDNFLKATMPAEAKTFQPYGVVHGGVNILFAETIGSAAAYCCIDDTKFQAFGQEVSTSHIRSISSGLITATASPIHLGRRSHIWEIRLENELGKLTCITKLAMAVVPIKA